MVHGSVVRSSVVCSPVVSSPVVCSPAIHSGPISMVVVRSNMNSTSIAVVVGMVVMRRLRHSQSTIPKASVHTAKSGIC